MQCMCKYSVHHCHGHHDVGRVNVLEQWQLASSLSCSPRHWSRKQGIFHPMHPAVPVWAQRISISLWDFLSRFLFLGIIYTVHGFCFFKLFPIGCIGLNHRHSSLTYGWYHQKLPKSMHRMLWQSTVHVTTYCACMLLPQTNEQTLTWKVYTCN